MGIYVNTYGTARVEMTDGEIAAKIGDIFDMTPAAIIKRLKLREPIYSETAAYGHMGRPSEKKTVTFNAGNDSITKEIETFTWEKLDYVEDVKSVFNL